MAVSSSDADEAVAAKQRLAEAALLRKLQDLRRSIEAGRPMTLPNCVRLCKRRLAMAGILRPSGSVLGEDFVSFYRHHQPFRTGAIRL
jgi:hypothetical protein